MKLRDVALPDSRFFLKAEYGALTPDWPVAAGAGQFIALMKREYRMGKDWIVYLGTKGEDTPEEHRGRLLSAFQIDTTEVGETYSFLSESAKNWAETNHAGRWKKCYRAVVGYTFSSLPKAAETIVSTNLNLFHAPAREISLSDRSALLELDIEECEWLRGQRATNTVFELALDHIAKAITSNDEFWDRQAFRLAMLATDRIETSGQTRSQTAPLRTGPTRAEMQAHIRELMRCEPLLCSLCGQPITCPPQNKLLKVSGDRIDSSCASYGPENYQLVHFACNLAKNDVSSTEFLEWLGHIRGHAIVNQGDIAL